MRGSFDDWLNRLVRALPFGQRVAPLQNRLASFAEQGVQGVANLLVNAILARSLTHEGFATIGTMLGVHYFIFGLHRTSVVLPYILDASEQADRADAVEGRWWWLNLMSLVVVAALLLAIATVAWAVTRGHPEDQWFVRGIGLCVLVTPALTFFEFGRRILYQRKLPATAFLISFTYLVLNLGIAWAAMRIAPTPAMGSLAWIVAGFGAGLAAVAVARPGAPHLREAFEIWWANRSFAFWQALTNFPYAVYNASVVVPVGLFGGPVAAAAFTATRTLTNPAISMVTAVDSLDKPRAAAGLAHGGLRGLFQSIGKTRKLLAIVCGLYLGLLIVFAGPMLHFAFGNAYANQVTEIRVLSVAFFLICLNQPSETALIVLRESRLMLTTRMIAAVLCIASLALAQPYGVIGACTALLVTQLINVIDLRIAEGIASRRYARAREIGVSGAAG